MKIEEVKNKIAQAKEPEIRRFHALMSKRIKTILMVSTPYEAFSLAWDRSLAEDIYGTFSLLHLQNAPQITTVTSSEEALHALQTEKFDLVLVSSNLSDMAPVDFAQKVKGIFPEIPIVMLIFSFGNAYASYDIKQTNYIDRTFLWQGSAKVLLSIIKLLEDSFNIDRDMKIVQIGVILVIEDSIKHYSFFLPHLYTIVMKHAFARVPYGVDENERQLLTRTRPKILLARNFHQAEAIIEKYKNSLHGVFSDLQAGSSKEEGIEFLKKLTKRFPSLPVLLISADESAQKIAKSLNISFADKASPMFIKNMENFCITELGLGEFIFRDKSGKEICRARSLREVENAIKTVPDDSIEYHVSRNHFSHWLRAQGEGTLAEILRPVNISDVSSIQEMRDFLAETFKVARKEKHKGIVADFREDDFEGDYPFLMIGRGSLGGKARGLAFMYHLLTLRLKDNKIAGTEIRMPHTLVIASDLFDEFMASNSLYKFALECKSDDELLARFLEARLPDDLIKKLLAYLKVVKAPLAIRSSSHLEDSANQPFAGLYETCMLPNNSVDIGKAIIRLSEAIKTVYASAFAQHVKQYFRALNLSMEEEKMSVIIQPIVGRRYGKFFYPTISGVAQSFNYYPFGRITPQDGIASLAFGFGKMVVEGGNVFRFSPKHPLIQPFAATPQELIQLSQKEFYALKLDDEPINAMLGKKQDLSLLPISHAEADQTLHLAASVISSEDEKVVDDLEAKGTRIITFAPIIKRKLLPLPEILDGLLQLGKQSIGSEVEIEFAVNIDFLPHTKPEFYLLQIRPMVSSKEQINLTSLKYDLSKAVCVCDNIMGNGVVENIYDVIYCHPARFNFAKTRIVAERIGEINAKLLAEKRKCLLIGPGRWGTRVPSLGIPVLWHQIAAASLIIECPAEGKKIDASQGAHFFHNLTSTGIGYFCMNKFDEKNSINWDFFETNNAVYSDDIIRHIRLNTPLTIILDAMNHKGYVLHG